MPEERFVRVEAAGGHPWSLRPIVRLLASLPLFLRLLPLCLALMLGASSAPSLFRWYAGELTQASARFRLPVLGMVGFTLRGLVALAVAAVFLRISAWACFELSAIWSLQRVYAKMVRALSRTRTTFYDENPSGRLINRLVRDFEQLRLFGVAVLGETLNALIEIASVGVLSAFAHPAAPLLIVPLLAGFYYIHSQRAPMVDHARSLAAAWTGRVLDRKTDVIEGRDTYRLYGRFGHLLRRLRESFHGYAQASALTFHIETWSNLWVRLAAEIYSLGILVFLAWAIALGRIDAALAGVILSALFGMAGTIGWLDFSTSQVARTVAHTRRVFEFVDLPAEEDEERHLTEPPGGAPRKPGAAFDLVFDRYAMSYRQDSPLIVKDFSLEIPAGSKVALIGRTGGGKTSLLQGLLRLGVWRGGDIRMGGRSIFGMDVDALRRHFGVVPQTPYLFAGTVRSNLDRTGSLTDADLRSALAAAGLDYDLSFPIEEGGQNFSQGERQLLCLARVMAAGRPILLLDEPTSGLDPETDIRIQKILRTAFSGKTVLTIAHRRESLWSCDRVVEIEDGRLVRRETSKS